MIRDTLTPRRLLTFMKRLEYILHFVIHQTDAKVRVLVVSTMSYLIAALHRIRATVDISSKPYVTPRGPAGNGRGRGRRKRRRSRSRSGSRSSPRKRHHRQLNFVEQDYMIDSNIGLRVVK